MGRLIILSSLFCISLTGKAQDINFSQFSDVPLLRNPALCGIFDGDVMLSAAFRTQWGSVTVPYVTQALGAQIRMPVSDIDYVGVGLQLTNDMAGDSKFGKTQALPVLAFNKCLSDENDTYLSLGISGGAAQQRFDASQLKFDDQFVNGSYSAFNPTQQTFQQTSLNYWDLTAGLTYSSRRESVSYYLGVALFHINRPRIAFDRDNDLRLNRKYVVNGGFFIENGHANRLIFYGDYFVQGGHSQGQAGFLYRHATSGSEDSEFPTCISAGFFYRLDDAVIPNVKLDFRKFIFGVSYDVNVSKLRPASRLRGAYELTLIYRDLISAYNSDNRKSRCPARF